MKEQTVLMNNLYTTKTFGLSESKDRVTARIFIRKEHAIFEGHFPGNPILPGVCTVQIIRELLEKAEERNLLLTKADQIKYLGFIDPVSTPEVLFDLQITRSEHDSISCNATVSANGVVRCSFKGKYRYAKVIPDIRLS
jgi:3-hydroxyacyl-[acyl-carrier-protein] dehydratase